MIRAPAGRSLIAVASLAVLVVACGDPGSGAAGDDAAPGAATLLLEGERIELEVLRCATIDGRLVDAVRAGTTETTLTASGTGAAGEPIQVVVQRSAAEEPPERIETVEITVGEVADQVGAFVLYRAYDAGSGDWREIDTAAVDARRTVDGPLVRTEGARLRAAGGTARPSDGRRVQARLDARCPVDDGPRGIA